MLLWIIHTGHYWRFGEERSPRRELKITGLKRHRILMFDFNSRLSTYGNQKVDVLAGKQHRSVSGWDDIVLGKKRLIKTLCVSPLLLTFIRTACTDLARTSISDQLFRVTMVMERHSEVRSYLCWDCIKCFVPNSRTCERSTPSRNDSKTCYVSVQVAFWRRSFFVSPLHWTVGGKCGRRAWRSASSVYFSPLHPLSCLYLMCIDSILFYTVLRGILGSPRPAAPGSLLSDAINTQTKKKWGKRIHTRRNVAIVIWSGCAHEPVWIPGEQHFTHRVAQ